MYNKFSNRLYSIMYEKMTAEKLFIAISQYTKMQVHMTNFSRSNSLRVKNELQLFSFRLYQRWHCYVSISPRLFLNANKYVILSYQELYSIYSHFLSRFFRIPTSLLMVVTGKDYIYRKKNCLSRSLLSFFFSIRIKACTVNEKRYI